VTRFDQDAFNRFVIENNVYGFFPEAITLKSGRKSHFYANWRTVVEDVWLTERLADFVLAFAADRQIPVDTFYGVPEGATKLGVICQYTSARQQPEYARGSHVLAMGRARPKEHGAPRDRFFVGMPRGRTIVMEDVTTTGGSSLKTLEFLKESGIEVSALISLTNRMERRDDGLSVQEAVEQTGVAFHNMSSALELLPVIYDTLKPGEKIGRELEKEYLQYGVAPISLL
jgi:orotate phosphoribosyltransferase